MCAPSQSPIPPLVKHVVPYFGPTAEQVPVRRSTPEHAHTHVHANTGTTELKHWHVCFHVEEHVRVNARAYAGRAHA
eukprot:13355430-Alexandrium_andersonii.AAC.1